MATFSAIPIQCPSCGATIRVPATPGPVETTADGNLVATITADDEPIREHVKKHADDPDWLEWLYNVVPVAYLVGCSVDECTAPVQLLSIVSPDAVVSFCRKHGQPIAEADAGGPVTWPGPLGYISADDPEPAA
jgi:hypothetical protein